MVSNIPSTPWRMLRLLAVGAGGTAVYVGLAAWAYTAATVGDMIGAGVLLLLGYIGAVVALLASEEMGVLANRSKLVLNLVFSVLIAIISVVVFIWCYHNRPHTDKISMDYDIGIKCQDIKSITMLQDHSRVAYLQLNRAPGETMNTPNMIGVVMTGEGANNEGSLSSFPLWVEKCEVTNYGKEAISSADLELNAFWRETKKVQNGEQSGNVIGNMKYDLKLLDFGTILKQEDKFYAVNYGDEFVQVMFPETIKILRSGSNEIEAVKMIKPRPMYEGFFLTPFHH